MKTRFGWIAAALWSVAAFVATPSPSVAVEQTLYISLGEKTRAPIGWIAFCKDQPQECEGKSTAPRDAALSERAWRELVRINRLVNDKVRPLTDMDHWGMVEKWSYPDDGYGDCEDYVLEKRRKLMAAGWPREALLITVVRDDKDEGHAVLTVKTDRGEFILDNQVEDVLPWTQTGYRYIKRQSQLDPNAWVALGDSRPALATATSR